MFFPDAGVSIAPGREDVPAFSHSLPAHRKPISSDEYLAGALSYH